MFHKICPQCGKEFHNSASKVVCCSTKCQYERLSTQETRTCKYCGNPFQARHKSTKECCSVKCRGLLKRSIGSKVVKACKRCGEEFESWVYRNQVYCSLSCKNIVETRQYQPKLKRIAKMVDLICEWCGNPYTVHQCMNTGKRKSRFCSIECRGKSFSATNRGSVHPNWRGGGKYLTRGRNWSAQRRKVLERDNCSCQICGLKMNNKSKKIIDVHHIKPYRQFNGDYTAANDLLNLITLCRSCHKRVEHGTLPCPIPLF